jgi:hypothetical protein
VRHPVGDLVALAQPAPFGKFEFDCGSQPLIL